MCAIFAGLTVHAETVEAERTFSGLVSQYETMHGAMPPVEQLAQIIHNLQADRLELYEMVPPWSVTVQQAMKRGLCDRELRRYLWTQAADHPRHLGLAKLTFALMLMGQNLCCLDTWILGFMYADDPSNEHQRRTVGDRISQQWQTHGRARSDAQVDRYEAVEDAFLASNPWYDPDDPVGRARAEWTAWEWALGVPASHRPWMEITKTLQLRTQRFPRPASVPF